MDRDYHIGIDTSLSKFAIVVFDKDYNIVDNLLIRTGAESNKKKYPWVKYFPTTQDKINYIVDTANDFISIYVHRVASLSIEGLSFASIGNATRDLAGVFHTFFHRLYIEGHLKEISVYIHSPMTIKKYARLNIKEEVPKNSKKMVMLAAYELYPEFLDQFVASATSKKSGREDYSDAIFAALTTHYKSKEKNK